MGRFDKADKILEDAEKFILEGKVYQGMDILKSLIKNAEKVIKGTSSEPLLDMALMRRQIPLTNKTTINAIKERATKANILIEKYKHLDICKHSWILKERLGMWAPEYKCNCSKCNSIVILCCDDHTKDEWEKIHAQIIFRDREEETQRCLRLASGSNER